MPSVAIQLRLPQELAEAAREVADRETLTTSAVVRRALARDLLGSPLTRPRVARAHTPAVETRSAA